MRNIALAQFGISQSFVHPLSVTESGEGLEESFIKQTSMYHKNSLEKAGLTKELHILL